jgi:hypothetical protein
MPSEAEIEAAALAISRAYGFDVATIEYRIIARAALSAGSAVRSEGVAWRSDMRLDVFEVDPSEPDGRRWKWKTILSQVPPIEGKGVIFRNITPLYTSPVQTREDGALRRLIRNLPSIIEDHACGGSDTRPVVDIDGLVGALTENVAALLSQPEPKGDK